MNENFSTFTQAANATSRKKMAERKLFRFVLCPTGLLLVTLSYALLTYSSFAKIMDLHGKDFVPNYCCLVGYATLLVVILVKVFKLAKRRSSSSKEGEVDDILH